MDDVQLKEMKKFGEAEAYNNPAFRGDESRSANGSTDVVFTVDPPEKRQSNGVSYPEEEDSDEHPNGFIRAVGNIQNSLSEGYNKHKKTIKYIIIAVIVMLYAAYFCYALYYEFGSEDSIRLLWVTCVVVFFFFIYLIRSHFGDKISQCFTPCTSHTKGKGDLISWVVAGLIFAFVVVFVIVDVAIVSKEPYNLVSLCGMVVYILLMFVFSYSPAKVRWRPVVWGLALQFILAMIILRWDFGFMAFQWLGDRVSEFLLHTDAGSKFVFGDPSYLDHFFAFKVLPVVIFFSTFIAILYHLGCMQVVIVKIAYIMQVTMGTTAAESLNAAGNIFVGQSEAPLLIRPMINDMTRSEMHAVMTGGFATIAGTVFAAYLNFGVPANHLLSASVMSAPAALAIAKLFYPETEKSKTTVDDVMKMERPPERNIIEAASAGASSSISLVANIAVNLIAFIALLHFVNATLSWFGARVGHPEVTLEWILSYVLWPFALFMGVDIENCRKVAELVGIKTILNEFVAYERLGKILENKGFYVDHIANNGTWLYNNDNIHLIADNGTVVNILVGGVLTERSEVIATYALCGFANIGSIGIMIGALTALAPQRKSDIASIAMRAMIAGNVACFMTACIAGLLYQSRET